jgi:hypothetical protein
VRQRGAYRTSRAKRVLALAICGAAIVVPAGCGEEAAEPSGPTVELRVTREFGHRLVAAEDAAPLADHDTVLKLLRGYTSVVTEDAFDVEEIEGLRGHAGRLDTTGWVFMVNGIEADKPPADYPLHPGDLVQWDLRDWYVTLDVRATVGAFPRTFTRGSFGAPPSVRVHCARPAGRACERVKQTLIAAKVPIDGARSMPPFGQLQQIEVLVGPWRHWRKRETPHRIDQGPRYSGIFARFSPDARSMRLLDWNARRVRTEGPGTGLIGAIKPDEEHLFWLVTGVDDEGVERASRAMNARDLRDAFAVAVTDDGVVKLPLPGPRRDQNAPE